jgi:hypothetical protein
MATPVSAMVWQITFRRESLTDQRTFSTSLATSTPMAVVTALAGQLRALGYIGVSVVLLVTLP